MTDEYTPQDSNGTTGAIAEPLPPQWGSNSGHGHVWPRQDGVKARCGGPALCQDCRKQQAKVLEDWPNDSTANKEQTDDVLRDEIKEAFLDFVSNRRSGSEPGSIDKIEGHNTELLNVNLDFVMAAIAKDIEAREAAMEPTLQDVIDAGQFPTPEEYKKMIWMLRWCQNRITPPDSKVKA